MMEHAFLYIAHRTEESVFCTQLQVWNDVGASMIMCRMVTCHRIGLSGLQPSRSSTCRRCWLSPFLSPLQAVGPGSCFLGLDHDLVQALSQVYVTLEDLVTRAESTRALKPGHAAKIYYGLINFLEPCGLWWLVSATTPGDCHD